MVGITSRALKQDVTWWATTPDGFGGDTFATPVLLQGRWEDRQETFIGPIDRREQISKAVVLLSEPVSVGDYLALGDYTADPAPNIIRIADKVQKFIQTPDLRTLEAQNKAML